MKAYLPVLILLVILTGCISSPPFATDSNNKNRLATAAQPIGTGYLVTTQYNMRSMHHWDLLAEKVASQASEAMVDTFGAPSVGVYFAPAGTTAFAKTYREALITHFLAYGIPVALQPEGNVILEIQTEMIAPHKTRRNLHGGIRHTVDPGFMQEKDKWGSYQRIPVIAEDSGYFSSDEYKAELQVNTSLAHASGYIYRDSSIFYVEPEYWRRYKQRAPIGDVNLKNYSLVNK